MPQSPASAIISSASASACGFRPASAQSVIVPGSFIITRFGIDYARVRTDSDALIDVPVQRGRQLPRPEMPDALEILSGLKAGDVLVRP